MKLSFRFPPILVALTTGLVVTAFVGYSLSREYQTAIEVASKESQNIARVLEEHARQSFRRINAIIVAADAVMLELRASGVRNPQVFAEYLRGLLPQDQIVRSFMVLDRAGSVVLSTLPAELRGDGNGNSLPAESRANRDYFVPHVRGADRELVFGKPELASDGNTWMLPISRRVSSPDGKFAGVLVAMVRNDYFQPFYDSIDRRGKGFVRLFLSAGWRPSCTGERV